eukprot:m.288270 g.288270  ORF g.288270 m.288270 type:complete len:50 (-) comp55039_c0_seq1:440-589(-)
MVCLCIGVHALVSSAARALLRALDTDEDEDDEANDTADSNASDGCCTQR